MSKGQKSWVDLLKASNTAPIIPKSNKFKHDFFEHKFNASLLKLLQLKGCHFQAIRNENQILFAPELNSFEPNFLYLPFSFGPFQELGWVVLGDILIAELLHNFLGGSPKVAPMVSGKPLTAMEKTTLASLNSSLSLSLREGLKGLLGIHDCEIMTSLDELGLVKILSRGGAYFRETFIYEGQRELRLDIFLKAEAFNPQP